MRIDGVHAPCIAVVVRFHGQPHAEVRANAQRPPVVDATGESEVQKAAAHALLVTGHNKKNAAPYQAKAENGHAGERNGTEVQPSTRCQGSNQRGKRKKTGGQAEEEMLRPPWSGEVIRRNPAALDEADDGDCNEQREQASRFPKEHRARREIVRAAAEQMGTEQHGADAFAEIA